MRLHYPRVIGDPVVQAVAFARQNKVDSILVGMKDPGGLGRLFSKGMAKRIADKTHVPVKALEEPAQS
ncbi:MAG: universal stress protein [Dehalococcoidia bacterium]|nr:universal stress protein [Dehalococcoidia bacterium]